MSLRALWIVSPHSTPNGKVLFSRSFPTVEKRVRQWEDEAYVPLPEPKSTAKLIADALGFKRSTQDVMTSSDDWKKMQEKPVFEVSTPLGTLWPLLVIEQYGLLYCCLPGVEGGSHQRPPLIDILGLSLGFSLLVGMATFTGSLPSNISQSDEKLCELHMFVDEAAPFGSPVQVDPSLVRASLLSKAVAQHKGEQKQAAWRQHQEKGRNTLNVTITEQIRAVLYDKSSVPDEVQVWGSVVCRADVEGTRPEVSLDLNIPRLQTLLLDPCVQLSPHQEDYTRSLCFIPPTHNLTLCRYTSSCSPDQLPLQAFFQFKGETEVEVLLQMKLLTKNTMDYCEVQIPFFHRGNILSVSSNPSHGSAFTAPNKRTLVWNIGRFPSRSVEISLKATVKFAYYRPDPPSAGHDPFCVGDNAYAQVFFKIKDSTWSGIDLPVKSVHVKPPVRLKVTTAREYSSSDFRVWNSHGDAPFVVPAPESLRQHWAAAGKALAGGREK